MQTASDRDYTIAVVSHALDILHTFLENGRSEQSAKEISDRVGLSRSKVFRLLYTLEKQDLVRQDPQTKRYRLGLKLFELGQAVVEQFDLSQAAKPVLEELTEQTGETTYIYVLDGLEAVTIAKRECKQPMRISAQLGRRDSLEVGAACNLLLAYLPPGAIDQVLGRGPLPRQTTSTITDPDKLREELEEIRRLGYHLSRGEDQEGVDAVAAPIRDSSRNVIAALAIAGPSVRFSEEKTDLFIHLVSDAAMRISIDMGYLPPSN